MRFRLVENVEKNFGNYTREIWDELNDTLRQGGKKSIAATIQNLDSYLPDGYKTHKDAIIDSIENFGYDPNENEFLSWLLTLKENNIPLRGAKKENVEIIKNRASRGIELNKEWYYNRELLNRKRDDFAYIINIADVLSDKSAIRKYFASDINKGVENIYKDNEISINGEIKDAGIGSIDGSTIYGMISSWTEQDGKEYEWSILDIIDSEIGKQDTLLDYRDVVAKIATKQANQAALDVLNELDTNKKLRYFFSEKVFPENSTLTDLLNYLRDESLGK